MKQVLIIIAFLLMLDKLGAQSGNIDLMAGHEYLHYQHSIASNFRKQSESGWQHIAALIKRYERDDKNLILKDELMNQVYFTERLSRSITLKAGLFYTNAGGYKPSVSVQYLLKKNNWLIILAPRADLVKNGALEMFLAAEFKPAISEKLRIYSRFQAMSSITLKQHNRSYQLIRLGIETKEFQFGAGLTLDEYGKHKTMRYNTGCFIRKNF
jgi:hypothetical protein